MLIGEAGQFAGLSHTMNFGCACRCSTFSDGCVLVHGQSRGDIILDLADRLFARNAAGVQAEPQPQPIY